MESWGTCCGRQEGLSNVQFPVLPRRDIWPPRVTVRRLRVSPDPTGLTGTGTVTYALQGLEYVAPLQFRLVYL